jgi:hypothetical protein
LPLLLPLTTAAPLFPLLLSLTTAGDALLPLLLPLTTAGDALLPLLLPLTTAVPLFPLLLSLPLLLLLSLTTAGDAAATNHCGAPVPTAVVTPIAATVVTHHSALAVPLLQLLLLLNTAVPLFPLLLSLTTARSRCHCCNCCCCYHSPQRCHCCHCCCHSLTTALLLPVFLRVRKVVCLP